MSVKITCISKNAGNHENPYTAITELGWINESTNETGRSTRIEIYDFLKKGNEAYVRDVYGNVAFLMTAETVLGTKYVKTIPDRTQTDNLLKLPECRV